MSREYMNRGDNFLSGIRTSVESGTKINWYLVGQSLGDLFYQTHRDGVEQGSSMLEYKRHEKAALENALSKLLEMGAKQVSKNEARHKREAVDSLETNLASCFREVVVDSLDLSGKKLDRLLEKYIVKLTELTEELKVEEALADDQ